MRPLGDTRSESDAMASVSSSSDSSWLVAVLVVLSKGLSTLRHILQISILAFWSAMTRSPQGAAMRFVQAAGGDAFSFGQRHFSGNLRVVQAVFVYVPSRLQVFVQAIGR